MKDNIIDFNEAKEDRKRENSSCLGELIIKTYQTEDGFLWYEIYDEMLRNLDKDLLENIILILKTYFPSAIDKLREIRKENT